jgi:hypothetical protein
MPPIGSVHKARIVYGDATEETSAMEVYTGAITAVSIGGFLTNFGTLQTATDAITLGTRRQQSWIGDLTTVSNEWPTDKAAQRESKLLVTYRDTVTEEEFILTIPTVDFDKLNFVPGGGDAVQFEAPGAHADIVAWVSAFEGIGRTPRSDQNAVEVVGMRYVGRNT